MKRRDVLSASALVLLAPATALAAGAGTVEYSQEVYEQALASGEPFLLDFFAPW